MRFRFPLAPLLPALWSGCAMLPPPPAGPPMGAGQVSYGMSVGLNFADAHATVVTEDGASHSLSGNGDRVQGKYDLLGVIANPRFAMRYAPTARWDAGGYAGGWDAGGIVRRFLNDPATSDVPVALVGGAQVGYALFFDTPPIGRPWEARAAVEFHPFIRGYGSSLISFGASYGRRRHGLLVPAELEPSDKTDRFPLTRTDFEITRRELRLELSLGTVIGSKEKPVATFTVIPYLSLGGASARGGCICAGNPHLESYDQSWGVAIVVGPSVVFDAE